MKKTIEETKLSSLYQDKIRLIWLNRNYFSNPPEANEYMEQQLVETITEFKQVFKVKKLPATLLAYLKQNPYNPSSMKDFKDVS